METKWGAWLLSFIYQQKEGFRDEKASKDKGTIFLNEVQAQKIL
jgi:hypothetical protein